MKKPSVACCLLPAVASKDIPGYIFLKALTSPETFDVFAGMA